MNIVPNAFPIVHEGVLNEMEMCKVVIDICRNLSFVLSCGKTTALDNNENDK